MTAVLIDPAASDQERRASLYAGDIVMLTPRVASQKLCELAWELIEEAFAPIDPYRAQFELPVEKYVEILSVLKPRFTHHARAKELLRELFLEVGCDPQETYFDVPKLRIATHGGYLTAGMGYAYKAHRDIWYACPPCQINWWLPIRPITERRGLAFHPQFFDRPVKNNSSQFDAYRWNAEGRKLAATYVTEDPRPHPHFQGGAELDRQVLIGAPGSITMFSAQHLHSTIPNDSGETRFSIDFRTVSREDIESHTGAKVVDSEATGTTLRDFLRATDHKRFADDVIATYETGGSLDRGVLVFDPTAA